MRETNAMIMPLCANWPPRTLTLLAFKEERRLEVWGDGRWLKSYPILAASGAPGVKRREGDRQVPEGIYRLTTLNPRSRFHLSIRVDYPDADDLGNGCTGSDIYIHGGAVSVGCIAVGNEAIEEIYRLSEWVSNRWIIIVPWDLRRKAPPTATEPWIADRYARLTRELEALR
jgi:L,D-transpeptidase-like protein